MRKRHTSLIVHAKKTEFFVFMRKIHKYIKIKSQNPWQFTVCKTFNPQLLAQRTITVQQDLEIYST